MNSCHDPSQTTRREHRPAVGGQLGDLGVDDPLGPEGPVRTVLRRMVPSFRTRKLGTVYRLMIKVLRGAVPGPRTRQLRTTKKGHGV